MKQRTWDYGTELEVTIASADKKLIVAHCKKINEGFMLMGHGMTNLPNVGSVYTIVFTKGGPTGGYWKIQSEVLNP